MIRCSRKLEKELERAGFSQIAGVDEAGRGPLAGPVVAAACIVPRELKLTGINDSKQLTPQKREEFYSKIVSKCSFGIGIVEAKIIDEINILQATFKAMTLAIENLSLQPDFVIFDGNLTPICRYRHKAIVNGDALSVSIAAASILAKCTRDQIMRKIHLQFPQYGFEAHKGYGTQKHLNAISKYGPCTIHRISFTGVKR